MFTGIIQQLGTIENIGSRIKIKAKFGLEKIGNSIAVDGVCLTITKITKNSFEAEIMDETKQKTTLGHLKKDQKVNLEPAIKASDPISGHFVTGHIDTTAEVISNNNGTLTIKFPEEFGKFMAWKGSVAINGVSLTITDITTDTLEVKLIPYTLKNTNLSDLKPKDKINIEVDILARYIKRLLDQKETHATYEFLKERNLL